MFQDSSNNSNDNTDGVTCAVTQEKPKASQARALGLTVYVTGKPCRRGHFAARYTKNGGCIQCVADVSDRCRKVRKARQVAQEVISRD